MSRAVRGWFTAAALLTFASVVMGAVVCATQSGASCPNWPGCYADSFAPAVQLNPMIEFAHRVIAAATGPTVLVAAILARRLPHRQPRVLAWTGLAGTIAAGVFGMLTVKVGIPWWLGMVDLACALTATACLILARVLLTPGATWSPTTTARIAWAAVGVLAALHLTGIAVAGPDSFTRCLSWPLGVLGADRWPLLQSLRLWLAVAAAGLIVAAVVRASGRRGLWRVGVPVAVLLLAEVAVGAALLVGQGSLLVRTAYAVLAAGVFGATALLAARASVAVATRETSGQNPIPAALSSE
ncbi:MAG TPA: COX15/CtaA family protein [Propionicimonas sp.]|jgi:cytochrome c oxidase assembly protein subunit 15|uniref:COX15/CtaA family protein n=1 Tax=Propionicimonas sp. TaxID=1955623 RepID=UPI002F3EB644